MDEESYMLSKRSSFQRDCKPSNRLSLNGNSSLIKLDLAFLLCLYIYMSTCLVQFVANSPTGILSVSSALPATVSRPKLAAGTTSIGPVRPLRPVSNSKIIKRIKISGPIQSPPTGLVNLATRPQPDRLLTGDVELFYEDSNPNNIENEYDVIKQIGSQIEEKLVPELCYIDLIGQFNNWVWRYRRLVAHSQGELKSAPEIIKDELGRAIQELEMEMCSSLADLQPNKDAHNNIDPLDKLNNIVDSKFDNLDYVYRSLKKLLARLEKVSSQLEKARNDNPAEEQVSFVDQDYFLPEIDDEKFRRNMERLEQVAYNFAGRVIRYELKSASSGEAFNSMSYFVGVANPIDNPDNFISIFAKIVEGFGSASTPTTVAYLRDTKLRSALSVLNANDPLPWIVCAIKKSPNDIDKTC